MITNNPSEFDPDQESLFGPSVAELKETIGAFLAPEALNQKVPFSIEKKIDDVTYKMSLLENVEMVLEVKYPKGITICRFPATEGEPIVEAGVVDSTRITKWAKILATELKKPETALRRAVSGIKGSGV